ncbi:MAG TPA: GNAT family N-acetyltransferase [Pyrinomonadaceae bacterium]|nr:GNAT family N-acetyltransferase [Pyrinomonadaceae bacterium]
MTKPEIEIREVTTVEDLAECVALQREVFASPDLEISPVRHLIVTRHAGGWTLGAYADGRLAGFVLSVPMFRNGGAAAERAFYSHMTAVRQEFQNLRIGARLKWAQRERALSEGVSYIKWTYQPVQARNAFFNLERLGATIRTYMPNFYGTDYSTSAEQNRVIGLDSDRLFADWQLDAPKAIALSKGEKYTETGTAARTIEIPNDWNNLVATNPEKAVAEQARIKREFQKAFAEGLICKGFERSETNPKYLLFEE